VTLFFEIKVCVFLKSEKTDLRQFFFFFFSFQGLGEDTCSLQFALESTAPGL